MPESQNGQNNCIPDLSTLTVLPCVTRFYCLSHGLTVGSSFLTILQILSRFFSQVHSFLNKQTQAAYSNFAEEHISSMINKSNTSSRSSLSLSWALFFIMLVKTHIDNPFQWKPPSYLLKITKKFTADYNKQHSSKDILR